ncbi:MAG TPA: hypothetical protein VFG73_07950 [Rhodanobacteraceae bacterium]|nr:hypothetical protein [Rhodanobacteraceae bacterium]
MRWLLALVALIGYIFAWRADSPGLLGLGLAIGVLFTFAAVLAFAQLRITGSAREETLTTAQMEALKQAVRKPSANGHD